MQKVKRVVAIITTSIIACLLACSCSSEQSVKYTDAYKNILQQGNVKVESTIDVVVNPLITNIAQSSEDEENGQLQALVGLISDGISIKATSSKYGEGIDAVLDATYNITFNNTVLSGEFYSDNTGQYISKSTIKTLMELLDSFGIAKEGALTETITELNADSNEYIKVGEATAPEITETQYDKYIDLFKNNVTLRGMASADGSKVTINMTIDEALEMAKQAFEYVRDNPHEFIEAQYGYYDDIDSGASVVLVRQTAEQMLETIENLRNPGEDNENKVMVGEFLKSSNITLTSDVRGDVTTIAVDVNLGVDGMSVLTIKTTNVANKLSEPVDKKDITSYTDWTTRDEPQTTPNKNVNADVSKVTFTWYSSDTEEKEVGIAYEYDNGDTVVSHSTCLLIDDYIYMPLRETCEACGLEVTWDGSKAGVIVDGENIDMTGIIHNDRTYIKIRDFEKLGVTVNYLGTNEYLDEGAQQAELIF